MKNKLEVGDYYRTKKGLISKVKTINTPETRKQKHLGYTKRNVLLVNGRHTLNDIKTYSKIKSEIVEVGDYVNGKLIHKIDKGPNYCYLYYGNCKTFVDYQIKTIVTKESFKEREYVF